MVLVMWAASFLMDLANPKYDPPDYVNPLIMLVGGYLFATSTVTKDKPDPKGKEEKKADAGAIE